VKGFDEHLDNAQWHLDTICSINQFLAYVHAGVSLGGGSLASMRHWLELPRMVNVPTSLKALKVYICGVDEVIHSRPVVGAAFFRCCLTLCLPEDRVSTSSSLTKHSS